MWKLTLIGFPRTLGRSMSRWVVHGKKGTNTNCNSSFDVFQDELFVQANRRPLCRILALTVASVLACAAEADDYGREIRPMLKQYCLGCHSTEKHKGDLDLERFTSFAEILKH